jgi:hypothetical protein
MLVALLTRSRLTYEIQSRLHYNNHTCHAEKMTVYGQKSCFFSHQIKLDRPTARPMPRFISNEHLITLSHMEQLLSAWFV